ncbi:MAG: hypothetical protein REI09_06910 [Candidatus Dactylopiibacterium sp.]|nr:hypothetical protein [Candidatus Dactylopiibacterium sp.]
MHEGLKGFLAGVAVCVALAGCASAPPLPAPVRAGAAADEAAKRFETRPGVARVYVYRSTRHGKDWPLMVSLGQTELGTVGAYSYMLLELPPGFHTLRARSEETASLELNLQAGRDYYVQLNVALSTAVGKPELLNMHPLEAQNSIRNECGLVVARAFGATE